MDSIIILSNRIDDLEKRIIRYETTLKSLEGLAEKIVISVKKLTIGNDELQDQIDDLNNYLVR